MSTPILATKLYTPPPRPHLVLRPRLLARLNEGLQRKLTLISAPAGFGKTTLVSAWIKAQAEESRIDHPVTQGSGPLAVAWLSLDAEDSDPLRFLAYLVAAVQTIAPHLGQGVAAALQAPQPPPPLTLLTRLLNELTTFAHPFLLVLDDYHLVDAGGTLGAVDQALTFLLDHLPPQGHLVLTTREDPDLPLARYRARDQLTEVRAADLRFTADETAAFLTTVMGLPLTAAEVAALEERTEGWIAGLQLAALSVRGRTDVAGFIQAFAGNHRHVMDYLVEEVLQRQPTTIRHFLQQTAILERLSGPLCDAVTGRTDSKAMLELLERSNLFVMPLDDQRHWYRYHHLFAELLQSSLREEAPEQLRLLHHRASRWYAHHDQPAAAIRHALAAEAFADAAALIERIWPAMRRKRQEATVRGWVTALPDELVRQRPVLSVAYALVLLDAGALVAAEERLLDAERWLARNPTVPAEAAADPAQLRSLPAVIANTRAYHAQARGDLVSTVRYTQQALQLVPADDHYERGTAAALLGLAYWADGQLEAAYTSLAAGLATLEQAGGTQIAIGGAALLAEIRRAQGRLTAALQSCEQALQQAAASEYAPALAATDLHRCLGELYLERGDRLVAAQQLQQSKELGQQTGLQGDAWRWSIAQARWLAATGEIDQALALLTAAEGLYFRTPIPDVRPIAALKARLWLGQGRWAEALSWAAAQGLTAADELSYLREYEHLTLARLLLAQAQQAGKAECLAQAKALLARLLVAAEAGARASSVIEILMLQALADQAEGNRAAALALLDRALALAEAEGYVQIFVEAGPALRELLTRLRMERGRSEPYLDQVLAAFGAQPAAEAHPTPPPSFPPSAFPPSAFLPSAFPSSALVEPLSERELAVLRLFKTELSGPEIAQELVIALSTLRTHTKNIYSKLNVNSRRAAVNRATELGLL